MQCHCRTLQSSLCRLYESLRGQFVEPDLVPYGRGHLKAEICLALKLAKETFIMNLVVTHNRQQYNGKRAYA